MTISPADAKAGQIVTISAQIHNLGTDPISNGADVKIYTKEALIATFHTPSLAAGGQSLVQTTWVVTDPNDFIYIEADPDNVLLEQDEFNNLAIVTIVRNVRFTQVNQIIQDSYRAMGDLNNDGALDVIDSSGSALLVNDGHGNFTDLNPSKTGFRTGRDYSSAFGDIDNDGYLDVFTCSTTGDNRLYKNNGNLTFTEITQQAGLKGINTYTVNAVFGDLNNDGYLDLFVGAYGGEQYIYLNNGDGTFRRIPGFSEGTESVELGDLDGDGYLDVVVCNGSAVIYKNDGTGHFTRSQALPGSSSWDVALGDMDNDGYLDIVTLDGRVYFNDGHGNFSLANSVALPRSGVYTISLADFDHNGYLDILYSDTGVLIRNDGNRQFTDITPLNKLNLPWYTVLLGDIDNDGDIDIVGGQYIYKNEMNDNNYLLISLRGKRSNYYGIGSKISVYEEGHLGERDHLKGFRQVQAGGQGYVSQDSSDAHFGVNSNYKYDVQVVFPTSKIVVNRRSTSTGQKLILPEIGDLSIQGDDISFSPNSPLVGEKVVMTAEVHNPTTIDMENVTVGFYDSDPATGGAELGRLTMAYVPAQGNKDFPVEASFTEGLHEIYVVIDPDNTILETDKTNNKASKTLTVVARIVEQDLSISASDITIDPVAPWGGAQVTISAVVHCSGENDIQNVDVSFYDGDPTQGGLLIGLAKISSVPVNGSAQTQIQWSTLGKSGLHYIHVIVDPQDLIRETNENNNVGIISVNVTPPTKPDLSITSSDIVFSNMNPNEGDPLVISATVHNLGVAVGNVEVSLYEGDPSVGGMLVTKSLNMPIIPSGGTATLSFNVDTVGFSGDHHFFISVDPDNKIDEMLETNNTASNLITIGQAGVSLGILTDKSAYTANENVQITVNINNVLNANRSGTLEVKILDLNGNVVSIVANDQGFNLGPNEKRAVSYLWNTAQTLSGDYKAYCDFIEASNVIAKAETPITIAPVKEIGSSVFPDKISYLSNQAVTITSTIQSTSPNYIFSSLAAQITLLNSQGTTLFTDTKTIPFLAQGQRVELKTYWNTSTNPRGTYTVGLEVLEGASLLGTSTASFEILGSSQTSEGILGTITAQPNLLYQGQDEILSYSVTNKGNEDISGLTAKVLIVNPDTQEVKNTLESTVNLPMGTTFTGNFTASTSGLPPRTYLVILQVSSVTITQAKTVASTAFKVIQAVTLPFSDNFDSYTVNASPPTPWFELGAVQGSVTDTEFHTGQNSITIGGGPENSQSSFVGLGETYPDRIAYEVWAKVNSTASSAYVGFSEEILGIMPQFNAVYFNGTDGKVYFTSADKDHGFTVPLLDSFAIGVWHKVRVQIDFANLIADVFIDDVLVGRDLPVSPKDATWEQDGTHSFQLNKIGVTHALGEPFYFDDFSVFSFSAQHTITATAGPGGTITPSGAVIVNHGESQTFTITPSEGYHVVEVTDNGVPITDYTISNVTADHVIQASFAINQYTITATAGPNGTITPSGSMLVDYGSSQTFTITPSEGYHVVEVTDNGVPITEYTISNVTTNHVIQASFAINQYTITATAGPNGTITPSGSMLVDYGSNQTFTITPSEGYHVVEVTDNGVPITEYTISNVTTNHVIQANFAINQYTIIATAGPNGSIVPSGAMTVDHGASQTFTMVPDAGYRISDVNVDGRSIGAKATYTFTNVTAAHTIEALFAINQHTIIAAAGSNGTITPSGSVTVDHGGSLTFTITPNTGYRISDVEVDGAMLGVTKSYTFSNVTSDHTIIATFKQIQVVSLPFSDDFEDDPVGTLPNLPWDNFNGGPAIVTGSGSHSPANSISVSSGPEGSGSAFVNLGDTYPDRIAYEVWAKVNSTASGAYVGFSEEILGIVPQFNAVYFNGTDGKVYFTSADRDHGFTVLLLDSFSIGVWHKVRVQIDFANLIADVFIDDVHVGSGLQVSPKNATWEYEGTHSFILNKIGVIHHLGSPFYFDDFSVSEWNPYTPVNLLRSAGPGQWGILGMGGIGSASSTSVSMSGSSSVKGVVANVGVADAGNVNMSGSSIINGILSLNTAGRLNKSGTSKVAGGIQQNTATNGILDQAVADALAASQSAASLPATITSPTSITISNPSQNITITGGIGTNVLHITNVAISNGTVTLNAPHGGCFIMNVSGSFALSGVSRIVLAGGITPSDVLYNFVGSGRGVAMSGGASVVGIVLAPQRAVALSSSTVTGEIISGGSGIAFSGTTQVNNPGP